VSRVRIGRQQVLVCCSNGCFGAAGGNRTLDTCLEGRGFTTKLQPRRSLAFVESEGGQAFALGYWGYKELTIFYRTRMGKELRRFCVWF
jgi:hypothetical protein